MARNKFFLISWLFSIIAVAISIILFTSHILSGAACIVLCFLLVSCIYTTLAMRQFKKIRSIGEDINQALVKPGRSIQFANMYEGDIAYLQSQIDKTFNQLAIASSQLEDQNKKLADYLADISHQIRTPLTSLTLELSLMQGETNIEVIQQRISHAETMLERIQWLISSLLKISRIDAGTVELVRRQVSVSDLIAKSFEPLALSFERAHIEFECDIQPNISFLGDSAWTCEALSNILKNSMEHTPEQGTVKVEAKEDALACRIKVIDSGSGIPEADIPYIFDRFYSASSNREVNPQGIGVGLSLAQALIVAQGGAISAKNEVNENNEVVGASFEIVFFKTIV